MVTTYETVQFRRSTSAQWAADNPILGAGEPGVDLTTWVFKIGDGVSHWLSLSPIGSPGNVYPSGDATGVTDLANITNALTSTGKCTLVGNQSGNQFFVNDWVGLPSGSHLHLNDTELIRVGSGTLTNASIITNLATKTLGYAGGAISTMDTDILITGEGGARIYMLNPAGVARANSTLWNYIGILMVRVAGLTIEDVQVGPTQAFGICMQGVTGARIRRIELSQDGTTVNQDGVDVGPGCSDVMVEDIAGIGGNDDVFSVFAHTSAAAMHPAVNATNLPVADITDLHYFNCKVQQNGGNFFRLNHGDGRSLKRVSAIGCTAYLTSAGGGAFIQFGQSSYTTVPGTVANGNGFTFIGCRPGRQPFIKLDQNVSGIYATDTHFDSQIQYLLTKSVPGTALTHNDITIDGFTFSDNGTVSNITDLVAIASGTIARLNIRNGNVLRCQRLLNNGATITGLNVRDIHIGILGSTTAGSLVASTVAETGTMDSVSIDTYAGALTGLYVGAALKMKLGPDMPICTSADTALATTSASAKGSIVVCDNTKQADGGAGSTAAMWIANGTTWLKVADLGAMVGR